MSRGAPRTLAERERDEVHMARCLELAAAYRGRTAPNPTVGCVIVGANGRVLAEGAHAGPGQPHAEIVALAKLGGRARGATLYVNLEPCNHHGRTPPCAPVVRAAGVARVVVGMPDPIPGHAGGLGVLKAARIATRVGVLRAACERANLAFLTWAQHHRPAFTLKAAITLDGKIATVGGASKWITGPAARADVMRLRDEHAAVMVGIGTVLADDPWLTARLPDARDPIRIVLDGQLRTPIDAHVLPPARARRGTARVILVAGPRAPASRERALTSRGAEVWRVPTHRGGRLDLLALARRLGEQAITSVLVEGGGEVHASLIAHRLADALVLYVAPKVVGGPAKSWVGGPGLASMQAAWPFVFDEQVAWLGGDLRLTAAPRQVADPVARPASRRARGR